MEVEEFAEVVGELMAGCQVPLSMGVLGAAREPLIKLREELGLGFGWYDAAEAKVAMEKYLGNMVRGMSESNEG